MSPIALILAVQLLGVVITVDSLAPTRAVSPAAITRGLVCLCSRAVRSVRLLRLPSLTVVILAIVIAVPAIRSTAYAAQTGPGEIASDTTAPVAAARSGEEETDRQAAGRSQPGSAAPARRTAKTKKNETNENEHAPRRTDETAEAPSKARADAPGEEQAGRGNGAGRTAVAGVGGRAPGSARQYANKMIAWQMLGDYGWGRRQYQALVELWNRESNWNPRAANPTSAAYGIPQANPGHKMAAAGPDWRTNPATQIKWGLNYIKDRYGSPIHALAHAHRTGWY